MMRNPFFESFQTMISFGQMLVEAQTVITLRTMGMAGLWNLGPAETQRMWLEKARAAQESGMAAAGALLGGQGPAGALSAALKPVRHKTRSNARRLVRRGPATL